MLSPKMEKALNDQIQSEFYSSYLYNAMAAYCHNIHLHGFAHWMKLQGKEEQGHAMKLFDYVIERDGEVVLKAIQAPPQKFKSIAEIFDKSLQHEKAVTGQIHDLYELAQKEKDYATQISLQWFVTEQVEEEAAIQDIVTKLKMISSSSNSLLYLDKEFFLTHFEEWM